MLQVSRTTLQRRAVPRVPPAWTEPRWLSELQRLLQQHPTFGYRRLGALLWYQCGLVVIQKAVYRVLRHKRWLVHQRPATARPRARGLVSRASRSNERWAMDVTHIPCGRDGWAHLAAVIDCHDRELIGYEFALRGRAKEAERALEAACLTRFGTLRPTSAPLLRSDNGLPTFDDARYRIRTWLAWYNDGRFASGLEVSQPSSVPCATINRGGLIQGEHYTASWRMAMICSSTKPTLLHRDLLVLGAS